MLTVERYGDVTRLRWSSWRSRALGYDSSSYATRGQLVDTGFPSVAREFGDWLARERPAGVLITHHHEDHAGNLELVAHRGIPVAIGADTLAAVRAMPPLGLYRRICWGSPPPLRSAIIPFEPAGLALLPSPGHAGDHHVVWDAERRTLFSGDLFLGVKVRVAQDTEHIPTLVRSLRAAVALAPERVFCAHRGLLPRPVSALTAKANWLEELMGEAARLRAAGMPEARITRQLLGREGTTRWFTAGEVSKRNLMRSMRG
jgi:ribonuclease/clavin/mitogillin